MVSDRANHRCEYCLLPESVTLHRHEPDHIVPVQHGGETVAENLALACMRCNRYKGTNIGSLDPHTGELVRFFDPRRQQWSVHFRLEASEIQAMTAEARATVKILRLNDEQRIDERRRLIEAGLFWD
jgi:hypothetical protein